jgi:ferric-dicitrate binding protein FerR (iron transport regulator)
VVAVEEGHVRVSRAPGQAPGSQDDGAAPVELAHARPDAWWARSDGRLGQRDPASRPRPSPRGATGRISFDHTPLAQALAEFERYRSTGLVIRDPAVAKLPVGGSLQPAVTSSRLRRVASDGAAGAAATPRQRDRGGGRALKTSRKIEESFAKDLRTAKGWCV